MVCPRCKDAVPTNGSACPQCGAGATTRGTLPDDSSPPFEPGEESTTLSSDAGAPMPFGTDAGDQPTRLASFEEQTRLGEGDAGITRGHTARTTAARTPLDEGPLAVGQEFGTRYRIIRRLGVGGMGAVYQAWDQELAVTVAIKVIRPEVLADPIAAEDLKRRFKRELLLAREVTHKNVVRIHDLGEINGIKYITMAYVEGDDLATVLRREGRLPVARVLRIARSVVSGLVAAHSVGIVHRDLKPANIMVGADDEALIMDFGIARSTGGAPTRQTLAPGAQSWARARPDTTNTAAIVGTVEYMAPEQAKALPADQRADVYAFGLIVYDLLTGRHRATHAESAIGELQARMQRSPPPVRSLCPDVPEAVDRLVSRCLEPEPDKRFQTTAELAAVLDRLDDNGQPIPTRRVFGVPVVAAMIVLVIALLGSTWYFARTRLAVAEQEPVSVLIADFENRANDPAFRDALEPALGLAMEGASFITIYRRAEAKTLAQQIKPGTPLDIQTARVISAREGVKYILAGTIDARNGGYPITIKALDPADGREVATAAATAREKDSVLKTVGSLAVQIRRALGDTKPRSESLAAMDPVTTVSLESIQAYSRGQELALAGKSDEALKVFEEAIALDPSLGRAYVQMAVIYGNQKKERLAEEHFQKALKYMDRMTERERYRTLGSYYLLVARNYEKAIENCTELVRRYPADNSGHANLAYASLMTGDVSRAVSEGRMAVQIYPKNLLQRTNWAMYAMYASDFRVAIEQANIVLQANPKFEYAILTLARAAFAAGDMGAAEAAYRRLRDTSSFGASMAALGQADIAMYGGRNRGALAVLAAGVAADLKAGDPSAAAQKYVAMAEARLAVGDRAGAADAALRAVGSSRDERVLVPAARTLIELGRQGDVEKIAAALENQLQRQTVAYARLLDGEQSLKRNRLASALESLQNSQKRNDSWFVHYLLGRTQLQAGHFAEALQEFDWCFRRKGLAGDAFIADASTLRYFPPVQYWLARAQEALGVTEAAHRNYREFAALRTAADPPDPLAADALKRLASQTSAR